MSPAHGESSHHGGAGYDRGLFASIEAPIHRPRPSLAYLVTLAIVALAMVVLPLLYFALMAGVVVLMALHAIKSPSALEGTNSLVVLVIYASPFVAGVTLLYFMSIPLFRKEKRAPDSLAVDRGDQPHLHAFVFGLCTVLGAPPPDEIRVDCRVGASAERQGLLRCRLVLTLGLPLIAALDLRCLAAVMAHEFGHFAQGAGTRMGSVIRSVSDWFESGAIYRDEYARSLTDDTRGFMVIVMVFTAACVRLVGNILCVLMHVGNTMSCFLTRRMEYDADGYSARLVGSEQTAEALLRSLTAAAAYTVALESISRPGDAIVAPDDLPGWVARLQDRMPDELRVAIGEKAAARRTGLLDTQPSIRDRLTALNARPTRGVLDPAGPALRLLLSPDDLSRRVTKLFFDSARRAGVPAARLIPLDEFEGEMADEAVLGHVRESYFQAPVNAFRPQSPDPASTANGSIAEIRARLIGLRGEITRLRSAYLPAVRQWVEIRKHQIRVEEAAACAEAGFSLDVATRDLPARGHSAVERAREQAREDLTALIPVLDPFEQAVRARLSMALDAAPRQEVKELVSDGEGLESRERLLRPIAIRLAAHLPDAALVIEDASIVNRLLRGMDREETVPAGRLVDEAVERIRKRLAALQEAFTGLPHPAPNRVEVETLADDLVPKLPPPGAGDETVEAGMHLARRIASLHLRTMVHLGALAAGIEEALGLEPLAPMEEDPAGFSPG